MRKKRHISVMVCAYCGQKFSTIRKKKYCSRECAGRAHYHYQKKTTGVSNETICWNCGKATGGSDCPWANKFKPVKGWTATPTVVKMTPERKVGSFIVHKCPLFVEG